jgi:hypothetical protein
MLPTDDSLVLRFRGSHIVSGMALHVQPLQIYGWRVLRPSGTGVCIAGLKPTYRYEFNCAAPSAQDSATF